MQTSDASEEPTAVDVFAKVSMRDLMTLGEHVTPPGAPPAGFLSRLRTAIFLAAARLVPLMVWLLR